MNISSNARMGKFISFPFLQLIENGTKAVRGPYLGRLELHHTMTELNENGDELLGDFLELLVEYFRKVKILLTNRTATVLIESIQSSLATNRAVPTT